MRRLSPLLLVAAVLTVVPAAAAQTPAGSVPLLVSPAWLEEHLQDPKVVVLYTDQGAHDEALIAGARAVPHESLMTMQGGHGLAATDVLILHDSSKPPTTPAHDWTPKGLCKNQVG